MQVVQRSLNDLLAYYQANAEDARKLYDRLVTIANDVGLYAEEYDPVAKRQLGNVPQAFTHLSFVRTASLISGNALMSIIPAEE